MNVTDDAGRAQCCKCRGVSIVLINGRCPRCNPFRACQRHDCNGTYASRSRTDWQNCFVCDTCGDEVSK